MTMLISISNLVLSSFVKETLVVAEIVGNIYNTRVVTEFKKNEIEWNPKKKQPLILALKKLSWISEGMINLQYYKVRYVLCDKVWQLYKVWQKNIFEVRKV